MNTHPPENLSQGDQLDQADIEALFDTGFGYQISGINPRRDDSDRRYVLVFANEDGPYSDTVQAGQFEYIGEGLNGDQSSSSPGNAVLIDAVLNPVPIYFFYKGTGEPHWEYQGQVEVVGHDYTERDGRNVFVFQMAHKASAEHVSESESRPGLYLVPISDEWYSEFERTVVSPYTFDSADVTALPDEVTQPDRVRIWGTTETDSSKKQRAIDQLETGDIMLFYYSGKFIAAGRAGMVLTSRSLGTSIWANPSSKHIFTLTEYTDNPLSIERIWPALGYEGRQVVQGFTRASTERVHRLIAELGAVEAVLNPSPTVVTNADPIAVDREKERVATALETSPTLIEETIEYTEHRRRARDTAFATIVKDAYSNTCAVCGSQRESPDGIPEVEAAHIYPKREGGSDDPRNGLALCRLHHWAFDAGWFGFSDDCGIVVREAPSRTGYEEFQTLEGTELQVPENEYKPHPLFLSAHRDLTGFESS
ncbi:HNH endonuclease [Halococcus sediminicola]|uniref:HNH endonuclease n=1 Tax=Halococcus sediminicola TaxID=1264579 RepID=UPI0006786CF9|nr:HNH endonuclease [Halococcus sediminicola]